MVCHHWRFSQSGGCPDWLDWMGMDGEVGHINIREMLIMGVREMDAIYLILLAIPDLVSRTAKTASNSCSIMVVKRRV